MALQLNRTYRFKFYLNANHYIIINGVEGETHPHTWEFTIDIMIKNDEFVEFNTYEKSISEYFAKYQNGIMNNFEPFDTVIPTLENMSSETPTRSYIISFEEDEDFKETIRNRRKESMDAEIDAVVDRIAQKKED